MKSLVIFCFSGSCRKVKMTCLKCLFFSRKSQGNIAWAGIIWYNKNVPIMKEESI